MKRKVTVLRQKLGDETGQVVFTSAEVPDLKISGEVDTPQKLVQTLRNVTIRVRELLENQNVEISTLRRITILETDVERDEYEFTCPEFSDKVTYRASGTEKDLSRKALPERLKETLFGLKCYGRIEIQIVDLEGTELYKKEIMI